MSVRNVEVEEVGMQASVSSTNENPRAHYQKLVVRRNEFQAQKASAELDLKQYTLDPSLYSDECIEQIRQQYRRG